MNLSIQESQTVLSIIYKSNWNGKVIKNIINPSYVPCVSDTIEIKDKDYRITGIHYDVDYNTIYIFCEQTLLY